MFAITACLFSLGGLASPALTPVPREPPPDPLARGYLGVTVGTGSLTVSEVTAKTPADKAGLKAGDVITRVGTLEPQNFDQVVAHITSFRPGAVLEIEVMRGSERKTFKVKLAPRPVELDVPRYPIELIPEP